MSAQSSEAYRVGNDDSDGVLRLARTSIPMSVLVTGVAGFIGSHVARHLLSRGESVVGVDNLNDFNPVELKRDRLTEIANGAGSQRFDFRRIDFSHYDALVERLRDVRIDKIIHLGAQAGVRYSITNPRAYSDSNLSGHLNILEIARERCVEHMIYASSSSVYGVSPDLPLKVEQRVDLPISLYAATKKSNELMSEAYSHLYRVPLTGLRFFTVYGPWGRPDMAVWKFTKSVLEGESIPLFNNGDLERDFTYIDDIVSGLIACNDAPPKDDGHQKPGGSVAPHRIYNIGNSHSENIGDLIDIIERETGRSAIREYLPMQPGDTYKTCADISPINRDLGFLPKTSIMEGVPKFISWYRQRYMT